MQNLMRVVAAWKAAGCTQPEAELRLMAFLDEVLVLGRADEDDPVRDVLDFVTGFCSSDARLFP
jgi:hypothetical protein